MPFQHRFSKIFVAASCLGLDDDEEQRAEVENGDNVSITLERAVPCADDQASMFYEST